MNLKDTTYIYIVFNGLKETINLYGGRRVTGGAYDKKLLNSPRDRGIPYKEAPLL